MNILLIEDESLIRTLFEDSVGYLEEIRPGSKLILESVPDYFTARTYLEEKPAPDVILLDLRLPRGGGIVANDQPEKEYGFQLLREIKSSRKFINTTVIVLTNLADRESEVRSYHLGADAFIVKSRVTPQEFFENMLQKIKDLSDKNGKDQNKTPVK